MALANEKSVSDGKIWGLCKLPFWHSNSSSVAASSSSVASSSSSFRQQQQQHLNGMSVDHHSNVHASLKVSSVAKSLLPTRRRLSLDPQNKLYFPCMFTILALFIFFFLLVILAIYTHLIVCHELDHIHSDMASVLCFQLHNWLISHHR